jgi:hypothetical protein
MILFHLTENSFFFICVGVSSNINLALPRNPGGKGQEIDSATWYSTHASSMLQLFMATGIQLYKFNAL